MTDIYAVGHRNHEPDLLRNDWKSLIYSYVQDENSMASGSLYLADAIVGLLDTYTRGIG